MGLNTKAKISQQRNTNKSANAPVTCSGGATYASSTTTTQQSQTIEQEMVQSGIPAWDLSLIQKVNSHDLLLDQLRDIMAENTLLNDAVNFGYFCRLY